MIKLMIVLWMLLLVLLPGCQTEKTSENGDIHLTEKAATLVDINNRFGLDLYREIFTYDKETENIMVSPLSVALALSMTYNGAESTTARAMENALRLTGLTREDINTAYQSLVRDLASLDPKVILEMANAIYYRQDFPVEKNFTDLNRKYYDAEVTPLDFNSPQALLTINGWVDTKTHGKITEILKEITPGQVMFLLNAIYFKGAWQKEFNKKSTADLPFFTETGGRFNVPMMIRTDTLDYAANDLFSAIRLPYGSGNYSMYVFLPKAGKTAGDIISQLNQENWSAWMKQFKETQTVEIRFPRLKFAYELKLNDVLSSMGMGIAFTGAADFSGISRSGGLRIDYVKHKTFVEVNEEGTEAAAVTIVAIEKTMVDPEKIYFTVDRPFFFAITEKSTGAILFMGTVKDPAAE